MANDDPCTKWCLGYHTGRKRKSKYENVALSSTWNGPNDVEQEQKNDYANFSFCMVNFISCPVLVDLRI